MVLVVASPVVVVVPVVFVMFIVLVVLVVLGLAHESMFSFEVIHSCLKTAK